MEVKNVEKKENSFKIGSGMTNLAFGYIKNTIKMEDKIIIIDFLNKDLLEEI